MPSTVEKTAPIQHGPHNDPAETSEAQLLSVAITVLRQGLDVVENVLTSDDQLTVNSKYLPGSTIGKHLRHVREHFVVLLDCISSPPPYILSYDTRSRNTLMESSLLAARSSLVDTISALAEAVPTVKLNESLTLNALTPHMQILETSFGRELWFATLHAIHHWSMIRVIAGELNLALQDDFGFAPSTLLYRKQETPFGKAKF